MGRAHEVGGSSIVNWCIHSVFLHPPPPTLLLFPFLFPCPQLLHRITLIFLWSLFPLRPDLFLFHPHHSLSGTLCALPRFHLPSTPPLSLSAFWFNFGATVLSKGSLSHHLYKVVRQGGALLLPSVRSSPCCKQACSHRGACTHAHTHKGVVGTDAFDRACWLAQNGCCLL